MQLFSFLATPLGIVMEWLYLLLQNYGWAIILFTILLRVVMFPLGITQQKSSAKMQAYQPMIQDIQKKWANDKNRQNQEMQKFYEENNIKMTAGCAPMMINMIVIFSMIAVIQAPLNYILRVSPEQVASGIAVVQNSPEITTEIDSKNVYTQQSVLIGEIKKAPEVFINGVEAKDEDGKTYTAKMDAAVVEQVKDFNFEFAGFNLAEAPTLNFNRYLILPLLSILTMFGSQIIIMKTMPGSQQSGGQMMIMTLLMGVMFGFYAFRVPVGFSLYYTVSNVVMLAQQLVLRKLYNPLKIRAEVEAEIEARRAEKKSKKKVAVKDEKGNVVDLEVSEAEMNKLRLAKAREQDAKAYGETEESLAAEKETREKARKLDEEKYGASNGKNAAKPSAEEGLEKEADEAGDEIAEAEVPEAGDAKPEESAEEKEYKPGRRRRAAKKQEDKESFSEQERAREQKEIAKEKGDK